MCELIQSCSLVEAFIGFIVTCTWHFSKFLRTYDKFFSVVAGLLCCKYARHLISRRETSPKGSEISRTFNDPMNPSDKMKRSAPIKMYPGLDITNYNVTVHQTILEEEDDLERGQHNTDQDNISPMEEVKKHEY